MRKANKGEWSEFYAFLKILFDHKLFSADETFTIIPESFLNVLSVIREENTSSFRYDINANMQSIEIFKNNEFVVSVPILKIGNKLSNILYQIQKGGSKKGSFNIQEAEELMNELKCTKIKAASHEKSDIVVTVEDIKSATIQDRGFSIKSKLGAKSTLLNASGATNFEFKVVKNSHSAIFGSKPLIGLREILNNNKSLEFEKVSNHTFRQNLEYVDSYMPFLMSELVKYYYLGFSPEIKNLTELLSKEDPLKKNNPGFYKHKIQELLISVALGMQPSKKWHGASAATGGYIVIREDGELACYHIYERDRFKRYLYDNTRLETPSRTRHQFGSLYQENGQQFIKLNLQIRFTN